MWLNALLVRILDQMLGNLMTHDLSQPVLEAIIIYEQVVSHPVVLFFNQVLKSPILAFSWRKRKKTVRNVLSNDTSQFGRWCKTWWNCTITEGKNEHVKGKSILVFHWHLLNLVILLIRSVVQLPLYLCATDAPLFFFFTLYISVLQLGKLGSLMERELQKCNSYICSYRQRGDKRDKILNAVLVFSLNYLVRYPVHGIIF